MPPADRIGEAGASPARTCRPGVRSVGVGREHQQPRRGRRAQRQQARLVPDQGHRPARQLAAPARRARRSRRPSSGGIVPAQPAPQRRHPAGRDRRGRRRRATPQSAGPAPPAGRPAPDPPAAGPRPPRWPRWRRPATSDWSTAAMSRASVTTTPPKPSSLAQQVAQDGRRTQRRARRAAVAAREPGYAAWDTITSRAPAATAARNGTSSRASQRRPVDVHHGQPVMRVGERLAAAREVLGGGRHARGLQPFHGRRAAAARPARRSSPNERRAHGRAARQRGQVQVGRPGDVAAHRRQLLAHRRRHPPGELARSRSRPAPCCPRTASRAARRPCSWPPSWSMATMAGRLAALQRRPLDRMPRARSCVGDTTLSVAVQGHARGVAGADRRPAHPAGGIAARERHAGAAERPGSLAHASP